VTRDYHSSVITDKYDLYLFLQSLDGSVNFITAVYLLTTDVHFFFFLMLTKYIVLYFISI